MESKDSHRSWEGRTEKTDNATRITGNEQKYPDAEDHVAIKCSMLIPIRARSSLDPVIAASMSPTTTTTTTPATMTMTMTTTMAPTPSRTTRMNPVQRHRSRMHPLSPATLLHNPFAALFESL